MSDRPILILVVEDEILIQDLMRLELEEGGYTVTCANDGEQGIAFLEAHPGEVGGLITDIDLGKGPRGWDVAHRARELNPTLPVIYVTGGSPNEWSASGVPRSVLLPKPFAPVELVVALSNLRQTSFAE